MNTKMIKTIDLADKIIKGEFPRFLNGRDLLEMCLLDMRNQAAAASISNEDGATVNAMVDQADSLETTVYNWDLKQEHKKFYKPQYVPICDCKDAIECHACFVTKRVA